MSRFLLGLVLFTAPLLGFSQTNSTQKCIVVRETSTGVVICIVPCEKNKGGDK
ncbi:MAG: hypothetical protein ABGX24_05345 [Aquificota bacterium]|jgi:hypothetical protein